MMTPMNTLVSDHPATRKGIEAALVAMDVVISPTQYPEAKHNIRETMHDKETMKTTVFVDVEGDYHLVEIFERKGGAVHITVACANDLRGHEFPRAAAFLTVVLDVDMVRGPKELAIQDAYGCEGRLTQVKPVKVEKLGETRRGVASFEEKHAEHFAVLQDIHKMILYERVTDGGEPQLGYSTIVGLVEDINALVIDAQKLSFFDSPEAGMAGFKVVKSESLRDGRTMTIIVNKFDNTAQLTVSTGEPSPNPQSVLELMFDLQMKTGRVLVSDEGNGPIYTRLPRGRLAEALSLEGVPIEENRLAEIAKILRMRIDRREYEGNDYGNVMLAIGVIGMIMNQNTADLLVTNRKREMVEELGAPVYISLFRLKQGDEEFLFTLTEIIRENGQVDERVAFSTLFMGNRLTDRMILGRNTENLQAVTRTLHQTGTLAQRI